MNSLLFICLILLVCIFILEYKKYNEKQSLKRIINFKDYLMVLNYHMDKAYAIIYKDKILIYSTEGVKINDKDFAIISKSFANLVLKMIGPNLKNEMTKIYGDEETLFFNIIEFFNSKYEEDEIQKSATDRIMNRDDLEVNNLNSLF